MVIIIYKIWIKCTVKNILLKCFGKCTDALKFLQFLWMCIFLYFFDCFDLNSIIIYFLCLFYLKGFLPDCWLITNHKESDLLNSWHLENKERVKGISAWSNKWNQATCLTQLGSEKPGDRDTGSQEKKSEIPYSKSRSKNLESWQERNTS